MAQFSGNLSADSRYSITLEVIETSYNTTNNTSDISYTLTATKSSGTGAYTGYKDNQATVIINGSTVFSQKLAYDFRGSTPKTITLASGTVKGIAHNADGRKSISVSASFTDTSNGKGSATASGTVTLTTIQRYLSITLLEIANKTEDSIVVRWVITLAAIGRDNVFRGSVVDERGNEEEKDTVIVPELGTDIIVYGGA
jgi:hypothetical protein